MLDQAQIAEILSAWGYAAVFGVIALESAGLPLPGETILIGAAVYAAQSGGLSLPLLVAAGAGGAAAGGLAGYAAGRVFGVALFRRYGARIGLGPRRLKLARYLFSRFGGWLVFFARFVTILRVFGAPLAGAHQYAVAPFLVFNSAGALVWATCVGALGYFLPAAAERAQGRFGVAAFLALIAAALWLRRFYRRNEARLAKDADAAFPGDM